MASEFKIDEQIKSLCFPLSEEEFNLLEKSLLTEGCRDALIIWKGLLLDGHHRFEICQKHGIEFETKKVELESSSDAELWVIRNQFSRRNLSPFQKIELALKSEPLLAEEAKKRMLAGKKTDNLEVNCPQGRAPQTRDFIAKLAGCSGRTVERAKKILEKGTEEQKERLRKNKTKISCVLREIKKKEHEEYRKKIIEEQKLKEAKLPEDKDGYKVKYYTDKWGNKRYSKSKEMGSGYFHSGGVIEENPEYRKIMNGATTYPNPFIELENELMGGIRAVKKLKKDYGIEEIKKAYEFNHNASNLAEAKAYFYPGIKNLYKKFTCLMEHLDF